MVATSKPVPTPKVVRVEAVPVEVGGAGVVVELDAPVPRRWLKALKREMSRAEGMQVASAKFDGYFVYIHGVALDPPSAARRVSGMLATVQAG
ncbi:hypothetical protein [Stenotrophomonas sp. 364]|uniref:hypothetical protein n=1 Tax=Stenotrophomonas sp. 364 TaxID=2691571 RepID=UPI0013175A56|nr:hypothetical protein [Stenotrophomonas sp. 364]QHB70657.1 hypothetical protein GQ674_04690 [Stenotrophomonas sp. 364]